MTGSAIILAGGFGKRLQAVISDVPKPMAPINGLPFLNYQLLYLKYFGIKNVILSVGHLHEKIQNYYGTRFQGLNISYALEHEPLGTGGGIRLAMEQCHETNVLVLNGDSFFDVDVFSYNAFHQHHSATVSLALRNVDNASRYGTICLNEQNRIVDFKEKSGQPYPGSINGGMYLIQCKEYLSATKSGIPFSIELDFFEKQLNLIPMFGFTSPGYFIDIGIPEDYTKAQHDFKGFKYI